MYSNGKNTAHSGEGRLVGNIVNTLIFTVMFAAGLYALSYWTLETAWWPTIACFALCFLAFAIPMHLMGRADSIEEAAAANAAL
ncbi:hypothetical protein ACX5K5_03855 [Glutamicibacter bergerei]|uniref:Uncharacterized protein n=2 Tax=Glutamicibacter TaxID=1742989 RepID=A0ABV9MS15_9MICC|nr:MULTISPECIES: hypothetical protein [Micrococcaceae]PCC33277.1 hypothetical protein CIK74_13190 [Glutamicibacter sp. BW77]PRB68798.1 hypothetical protein CQ011_13815 [Arthrobacter sp. MYb213]GGJ55023.1 hypothetical protein GCM10007173_12190 [Glutamicibacter ardleyensis]HBV09537.1 hypothetical protein [Micrococcaceae bacterium]